MQGDQARDLERILAGSTDPARLDSVYAPACEMLAWAIFTSSSKTWGL
jgi:hypothetical protein